MSVKVALGVYFIEYTAVVWPCRDEPSDLLGRPDI